MRLRLISMLVAMTIVGYAEAQTPPTQRAVSTVQAARAVAECQSNPQPESIATLLAYLRDHPNERRIWKAVGTCYLKSKSWEDAIRAFDRAIVNAPDDAITRAAQEGLAIAQERAANAARFRDITVKYGHLVPAAGPTGSSIEWFTRLARALMERGARKEAIAVLQYRLYNSGESPELRLLLARAFLAEAQPQIALDQFAAYIAGDPQQSDGWAEYIDLLLSESRTEDALTVAREGVARFGDQGGLRIRYARALLATRRLAEAARQHAVLKQCRNVPNTVDIMTAIPTAIKKRIETLKKQLSESDDFEAAEELRLIFVATDRPKDAVKLYRELVDAHPEHFGLRRQLALLEHLIGRHAEAHSLYTTLIQYTQGDLAYRLEYARLLGWIGLYDDALGEFDALDRIAPGDGRIVLYRAFALLWSGAEDEARRAFELALEKNPGDPLATEQLQLFRGQYAEILPARLRRYHLDPLNREAVLGLADLLRRMGDIDRSLELYDEYLSLVPDDHRARRTQALLLAERGDYELAIRTLTYLLRVNPEQAKALREDLARVHLWAGANATARTLIRELLTEAPKNPRLLTMMGYALIWDGAIRDGIVYLERALALDPDNVTLKRQYADAQTRMNAYWEMASLEACGQTDPAGVPAIARMSFDDFLNSALEIYPQNDWPRLKALYSAYVTSAVGIDSYPFLETYDLFVEHLEHRVLARQVKTMARCGSNRRIRLPTVKIDVRTGNYDDLIALHRKTLASDPKNPHALLALADLEYARKRSSTARDLYLRYLDVAEAEPAVQLRVALLLRDAKRYAEAVPILERLKETLGDNACLDLHLATALYWNEPRADPRRIITLFRRYMEVDPGNDWPHRAVGDLLLQVGSVDEAITAYRQALVRTKDRRPILRAITDALFKTGRSAEAIALLREQADDGLAMLQLAEAYGKDLSQNNAGIRATVEAFLKNQPSAHWVRLALARALAQAGEPNDAAFHYNIYLEQNPTNHKVLKEAVFVLSQIKAYDEALALIDRFLAKKPAHPMAVKLKADLIYWRGGNLKPHLPYLIETYLQWIAKNPDDVDTRKTLAWAYAQTGDWHLAATQMELYRLARPNDTDALMLEASIWVNLERRTAAIAALKRYLAAHPEDISATIMLVETMLAAGRSRRETQPWISRLAAHYRGGRLTGPHLLAYARIRRSTGSHTQATRILREFLADAPADHPAWMDLAGVYLDQGRTDDAIVVLTELVEQNPEDMAPQLMLAQARLRRNTAEDRRLALETFSLYLDDHPNDLSVRLDYAGVYEGMQAWADAEAEYRRVVDDDADDPHRKRAELGLVRIMLVKGHTQDALDQAEDLRTRLPHDLDVLMTVATTLESAGREKEALDTYREVMRYEDRQKRKDAQAAMRRIDLQNGPLGQANLGFSTNSDGLDIWLLGAAAGVRSQGDRRYIGARYQLRQATQTSTLTRPPDPMSPGTTGILIASPGSKAVHTLLLEGRGQFSSPFDFSLSGHAGIDIMPTGKIVPDLRIGAKAPLGDQFTLAYDAWYHALFIDVGAMPVLDFELTGFWHRLGLTWAPPESALTIDVHARNAFINDFNMYLEGGALALVTPFDDVDFKVGGSIDAFSWKDASLLYWDPHVAWHGQFLGILGLDAHPTLRFNLKGTLGYFREEGHPGESPASALTFSAKVGLSYTPQDDIFFDATYFYGQSGQSIASTVYTAHVISASLRVLW